MDHTLWDFERMMAEQAEEVERARTTVITANNKVNIAHTDWEASKDQAPRMKELNMKNCQLHRNEEINLFHQCYQDKYNNYSLNHFPQIICSLNSFIIAPNFGNGPFTTF